MKFNYVVLNLTVKNQKRSGSMVTNESGVWKRTVDKGRRSPRNINHCPRVELWHTSEAKMVSCKLLKERSGVGPYKRKVDLSRGYFFDWLRWVKRTCSFVNF